MRIRTLGAMLLLTLLCLPAAVDAEDMVLREELARLRPWIGIWQIEARWAGGGSVWAQSEYRPLLGGAFVEVATFVKEDDGPLYQRYWTVLAWDSESETFRSHTFGNDGSYTPSVLELEGEGVGLVATSTWKDGDIEVVDRVELTGGDEMAWVVDLVQPGSAAWSRVMDAVWHRVDVEPVKLPTPSELDPALAEFTSFLGGWEIDATWVGGTPLWARTEYATGLAGRFLSAATWTSSDGQSVERTLGMVVARAGGGFDSVAFLPDGVVVVATTTITREPDGAVVETLIPSGPASPLELRQALASQGPDSRRWQVWGRSPGSEPWTQMMDGVWRRQGPAGGVSTYPIDAGRFVASGRELRSFTKEVEIAAPVEVVFGAWTTGVGLAKVFGPPSASHLELAIGGRYEWLFDGAIGGNGCQVLSYIPNRMVSFSWNSPPSRPECRLHRTWVVVELEPAGAGERTLVRLTHLGFGAGEIWDQDLEYFERAWAFVLGRMQRAFENPQEK